MSDIVEVKSRLDIVDVVSDYLPALKKTGRSYQAPCPFHKEKTPSFNVTPDLQRFKCFGCGEGGDVLSFIQKIERVDFPKALEIAAEKAGYKLTNTYSKQSEELKQQKEQLIQVNTLAAKYWNYLLKTHKAGKPGREYARTRRLRVEEIDKFMIGYAPKGKTNLVDFLTKKGFEKKKLVEWGLATERDGRIVDKFVDRLILSIFDARGNIVAFSGRKVAPSKFAPKYLNSPETLVYRKGDVLMGLYQAIGAIRDTKIAILEEGNIDLLSSHKVGVENIVATGGTALTEAQLKLVKRYADIVYFAFDTDQAGIKALTSAVGTAERIKLAHKAINLGEYQDPDELISADPELWKKKVVEPMNSVEFLHKYHRSKLDLGNPDHKSTLLAQMVPILKSLQDKVQLNHFAKQVALDVGLSTTQVLDTLEGKEVTTNRKPQTKPKNEEQQEADYIHPTVDKRQIYLLALLIETREIDIDPNVFTDINAREIAWKLRETKLDGINFGEFADQISDGAKETLQEVLAVDLSGIDDINKETQVSYNSILKRQLQSQLLNLRQELQADADNIDLLQKLQQITQELSKLK